MLRSMKKLRGYKILATDGHIGRLHGFYFNDNSWAIKYLVVDIGEWNSCRLVLIPQSLLGQPDILRRKFPVSLTTEEIKNSPCIDTDKPVSQQMEEKLYSDYDWSLYWIYGEYYPIIPIIRSLRRSIEYSEENSENQRYDNHLRSANEVTHYHLKGIDGKIGYIKDFIVDDSNWVIKYIEFDIRSLIRTKRSAISANLVKDIKWSESTVYANASRENLNEDIRHKTKAGHGFLIAGGG